MNKTDDMMVSALKSQLLCAINVRDALLEGDAIDRSWEAFARTWDDLVLDRFMRDNGTYRKRRFSELALDATTGAIRIKPHRPFFQSAKFNQLNGGFERHFDPVTPEVLATDILTQLVRRLGALFTAATGNAHWDVNVHQVRIEATREAEGRPVPEGMHRDGVSFTSLVLIERHNVEGAENLVFDDERRLLMRRVLRQPGDAILLDDTRTYHDTTPVRVGPDDDTAHRDMFFFEFTAQE